MKNKLFENLKKIDSKITIIIQAIKGFFIGLYQFIKNSQVLYWISRHTILVLGLLWSASVLINIPNLVLYVTFVILMEFIALILCSIASYAYTNKKLTKSNSDIILAAIFIGVHLVVAVGSTVIYSDLF